VAGTLEPPYPPLAWDLYFWTGPFVLPAWAGFRSRRERDRPRDFTPPVSDGSASLNVMTPGDGPAPPAPAQAAAYLHLVEHQEEIRDAILKSVLRNYDGDQMPDLQDPEELRPLIGLSGVNIFTVAKDGIAYVGFEFRCTWEEEHGLGAMTHAGRVVGVGHADMGILEWIAEQDAKQAH